MGILKPKVIETFLYSVPAKCSKELQKKSPLKNKVLKITKCPNYERILKENTFEKSNMEIFPLYKQKCFPPIKENHVRVLNLVILLREEIPHVTKKFLIGISDFDIYQKDFGKYVHESIVSIVFIEHPKFGVCFSREEKC